MDENNENPQVGRITLDDVRAAIGDTDPLHIGATKVRQLLGGKGSYETIQKHINTLRDAAIAAAAPVANAIPAVPEEVRAAFNAMWASAWSGSEMQYMRKTEALTAERDAAMQLVRSMTHDAAEQSETVCDLASQIEAATSAAAVAQTSQNEAKEAAKDEIAQLTQELAAEKAAAAEAAKAAALELSAVQARATYAADLASQGRDMMRVELQRLTDQVGELKAHLYQRAAMAL